LLEERLTELGVVNSNGQRFYTAVTIFYTFSHLFININSNYRYAKKFQSWAYHIPDIFLIEPIEWGKYKDRIKGEI
jgi:hypothetical protein